ncbi:dodecin [Inquilinus sp. NPDC058860]|uniref:dodecin n=1 Tax=Inquilinus sp. NPDC058860 TaxID=3346652 RepID=UPI0036BB9DA3
MGHTYAITELAGSSERSLEDAIQGAIATASKTLRNLEWFEVKEIRGHIEGDRVGHYQVVLRLGFRYEQAHAQTVAEREGRAADESDLPVAEAGPVA